MPESSGTAGADHAAGSLDGPHRRVSLYDPASRTRPKLLKIDALKGQLDLKLHGGRSIEGVGASWPV